MKINCDHCNIAIPEFERDETVFVRYIDDDVDEKKNERFLCAACMNTLTLKEKVMYDRHCEEKERW
ncbi:hypothetical protein KA005_53605, partial [bacterium]|nr:hypothetical protein [bacterium]